MNLPASEIKPKDIIVLDCGYGPQSNDMNCKVLNVNYRKCMFSEDKEISFEVEIQDYTRERFDTYGFKPTDLIEVFSVYKKRK
jgi:hypothetical protein